MFNDFKNLHYESTTEKLRKLKDIFCRLNLSALEQKYADLLAKINSIELKVAEFQFFYASRRDPHVPYGPGIPPVLPPLPVAPEIPPVHPTPPPYPSGDGKTYIIVHGENPEGFEIGQFDSANNPIVYINNLNFINTPDILSEHNQKHEIHGPGFDTFYGSGPYSFKCIFNGTTVNLGIVDTPVGYVTTLIFTFSRIDSHISVNYTCNEIITTFPNLHPGEKWSDETSTFPIKAYGRKHYLNALDETSAFGQLVSNISLQSFYMALTSIVINNVGYMITEANSFYDGGFNVPISLSPQSFIRWYSQSLKTGNYPASQIIGSPLSYPIVPGGNLVTPTYYMQKINANQSYTAIRFTRDASWQDYVQADSGTGWSAIGVTSGSLINGGLKISSVPYDVIGTAF